MFYCGWTAFLFVIALFSVAPVRGQIGDVGTSQNERESGTSDQQTSHQGDASSTHSQNCSEGAKQYSCPSGLLVDPTGRCSGVNCQAEDFEYRSKCCKRWCGEATGKPEWVDTNVFNAQVGFGDGCNGTVHGGECEFTCQTHVHAGAKLQCNDGVWNVSNATDFAFCKPRNALQSCSNGMWMKVTPVGATDDADIIGAEANEYVEDTPGPQVANTGGRRLPGTETDGERFIVGGYYHMCQECPAGFITRPIDALPQIDVRQDKFRWNGVLLSADCGPNSTCTIPKTLEPIRCAPCARWADYGSKKAVNQSFQNESGKSECKFCPRGHEVNPKYLRMIELCFRIDYDNRTANESLPTFNPWIENGCDLEGFGPGHPGNHPFCEPCAAGKFNDAGTSGACKECPLGWQSTRTSGSEKCEKCNEGKFRSAFVTVQTQSSPNRKSGGSSISQESLVPNDSQMEVIPLTECQWCPSGKYQSERGKEYCTNCPQGRYTNPADENLTGLVYSMMNICHTCSAGKFFKEDGCDVCPSGYYQDQNNSANSLDCLLCPQGFAYKDTSHQCTMCSLGRYQPSATTPNASCLSCPAGFFGPINERERGLVCNSCAPGRYTDEVAQRKNISTGEEVEACVACPAGQVNDRFGSSGCSGCAVGKYQDDPGSKACKNCTSGRFGRYIGLDNLQKCSVCPQGYFQDESGKIDCGACGKGKKGFDGEDADVARSGENTGCTVCEEGRYGDEEGQTECKACFAGKFRAASIDMSTILAKSESACLDCQNGTFSKDPGQANCTSCDVGEFQNQNGRTYCFPCFAGRYQNENGSSHCEECDANTYQANAGQASCVDCAGGTSSDAGATFCAACDAGKYMSPNSVCESCPAGYASIYGQAACTECVRGKYANTNENATECTLCPAGTHGDPSIDISSRTNPSEACNDCPAGKYSSAKGLAAESECNNCASGKFSVSSQQTDPNTCESCPQGFFSNTTNSTSCTACAVGESAESGSAKCIPCGAGRYGVGCEQCTSGQFREGNDADSSKCKVCNPGFHQDKPAQASCLPCVPGKYQAHANRSECEECGVDTFSNKTELKECFACDSGSSTDGNTGAASCIKCSAGKYGDSCTACPSGYYRGTQDSTVACKSCNAGQYQKENGTTLCLQCLPGQFGNDTNMTSCHDCDKGRVSTGQGAITCTNCDAGQSSDSPGSAQCTPCVAGKYSDVVGEACKDCDKGRYRNSSDTATDFCRACSKGTYQDSTSAASCLPCLPGEFGNTTGMLQCHKCAIGKVSETQASTLCADCEAGWSSDSKGSAKCTSCGAGQYSDMKGEDCKNCPHGQYRPSGDGDPKRCLACKPGETTQSNTSGAIACDTCDLGMYGHSLVLGLCVHCQSGRYQDARGRTECMICDFGKIANSKGTACEKPPWITANDCKPGREYLDDRSSDRADHSCEKCLDGADCTVPNPLLSKLKPLPGYRAMSWNQSLFGRCPVSAACNTSTVNKTEVVDGCSPGHSSELCSQCMPGWATSARGRVLCTRCPEQSVTAVLYATVVLVTVCIFTYLVWDNLNGARDMVPRSLSENGEGEAVAGMPFHSISIRIVSSYLQVAGLLTRFDLTLPESVTSLVNAEASSSSLSEQLLKFECGTSIRNDREIFLLRQVLSVWLLPLTSIACCLVFWFVLYAQCCWRARRTNKKNKNAALDISPMDGFVSSLMVLFYTLFPSVVNRVALTFSCQTYGDRLLLTEALSIQCFVDGSHRSMIFSVGIPGLLLFVLIIPGAISRTLINKSRAGKLYPTQPHYEPKWTMRIGFMFAGYRQGYEGWESIVMLRKCGFVILSVFLRSYGPSPQVVAASIVIIMAISAHLQHRPYLDEAHNWLESCGLHACIAQLLVTLISNMIGRIPDDTSPSQWTIGPVSTSVVITVVFCSTLFFFWTTFVWTARRSHGTKGAVGATARCCHKVVPRSICVLEPRYREQEKRKGTEALAGGGGRDALHGNGYLDMAKVAPTMIMPSSHEQTQQSSRTRLNARLVMMGVSQHRNQVHVNKLEEQLQRVKLRKVASIKRRGTERSARLQLRLEARAKVKHSSVLQRCAPFANLSAESISTIVDAMEFKTAYAGEVLCRKGEVASGLFILVDGLCDVMIGERKVAVLPELTVFGESSLFEGGIRNATVIASEEARAAVKLLLLSRVAFAGLMQSGTLDATCVRALQEVAARRQSINENLLSSAPQPRPKARGHKEMGTQKKFIGEVFTHTT